MGFSLLDATLQHRSPDIWHVALDQSAYEKILLSRLSDIALNKFLFFVARTNGQGEFKGVDTVGRALSRPVYQYLALQKGCNSFGEKWI
jgi:hypothetical protein